MLSPLFSVIVPFHNAEKYLNNSILSITKQTLYQLEIILIDDGSSDNSLKIASQWLQKDKRISLLQHPNGINKGVSASRNLGIQNSKAEWIAFLDADDVWLPEKLERQYKIIQKHHHENLVLLYGQAKVIDESGDLIDDKKLAKSHNPLHTIYGSGVPGFQKNAFKWTIKGGFDAPTSTVVCKKELIKELHGFEEDMHFSEDAIMWYRMIEKGNLYFLEEPIAFYRVHQTQWNASATIKLKSTRRFIAYERLLLQSNKIYQKYISSLLVEIGFRNIVKINIGYPYLNGTLIFRYWSILLKNKQVKLIDKFISPIIVLSELLILPFRLIYHLIK